MATFSLGTPGGNVLAPAQLELDQRRQASGNLLDSIVGGLQQGVQLQQLPEQIQQQALAQQLNAALVRQKLQDLQNPEAALQRDLAKRFQEELIKASFDPASGIRRAGVGAPPIGEIEPIIDPITGGETPFVRDLEMRRSALARGTRPSPFQSVGLTSTPEGVTQGVVFNPAKGDFEIRDLPSGVSDIRPKLTQPTKARSEKGLTANQQSNLRLRGGRSLVDINDYTDPETGQVDWNSYSTKIGEAEGSALHSNNLIKEARSSTKTTLDEKNLQLYGNRMDQANTDFNKLTNAGFDPTSLGKQGLLGGWLPNLLKPVERQQYEQAERNFINASLRRESGAVITDDEFANARKQYFPQPGDGEGVLTQKTANRKLVIDEFKRLGGQQVSSPVATPGINPNSPSPIKINSIRLKP